MKLADYLAEEGLTNAEFARRTGLSEGTISLLASGKGWLSRATARRILDATDQKVTPTDFVDAEATQ